MTLSRTARVLLAMLLIAAAAFVWVNFFASGPSPVAPIVDVPPTTTVPNGTASTPPPSAPPTSTATAGSDATQTPPAETESQPASVPVGGDATPTVVVDAAVAVATPDGGSAEVATPTVVTGTTRVTVSDVQVLALPFLVTEPPPPDELAIDGQPIELGPRLVTNAPTPVRTSVNPFSPIVLPAVAEVPEPAVPAVVEVTVPVLPTAAEILASRNAAADLAPRALTPRSPTVVALPRSLPTGGVLSAPSILTTPRTPSLSTASTSGSSAITPSLGLANLALPAARVPSAAQPTVDVALPRTPEASSVTFVPDLLASPRVGVADADADLPASGEGDGDTVRTDLDPLQTFLVDREVAFTGSVLGNVAVGVFRVGGYTSPVVLSLGQTLLDTEIVLTDVGSQSAEFTLGDLTHVLTLELGR